MRITKDTKRFRKDYIKLKKSGRRKMNKLHEIMEQLIDGKTLALSCYDHDLKGEWKGFRDCHIEGDWVLIYRITKNLKGNETITFCATDNHSNLFK
jgi:mRNA interferase YafQ